MEMASCTAPAPAPVVAAPAGSARNVNFSPPPDESAEAEEGDPEARSAMELSSTSDSAVGEPVKEPSEREMFTFPN